MVPHDVAHRARWLYRSAARGKKPGSAADFFRDFS
jgi:hypothetical protein